MPHKRGHGASFRVELDDTAFAEDQAHSTPAGRDAALRKRVAVERDGQPADDLITCDDEARDGTRLPGCFKTYVPWPTGRWGMVFELRFDENRRPYLAFLAFGVRHHPKDSHALSVYQIADQRLTGRPLGAEGEGNSAQGRARTA